MKAPPAIPAMTGPNHQPPDKNEKALDEKLTEGLFKLLVAGGGGYSLYNLYLNDIPKAVIAGSVSFGFSLLTSFGKPMVAKWKSGLNKLGEQVGVATNQEVRIHPSKRVNRWR